MNRVKGTERKRPAKRSKRELLSREGSVTSWGVEMHMVAWTPKGADSRERTARIHLTVRGTFTEPVKGVSQFAITMTPVDRVEMGRAEIPSVGVLLKAKPVLEGFVTVTPLEFQTLLLLANAGQLRYCLCTLQEPHYGSGLISGLLLTTEATTAEEKSP